MLRLGLCCKFKDEPIRFYTTTARYLKSLKNPGGRDKISRLCLQNAGSLLQAIEYCGKNNIGSFRINSRIFPLKTHPDFGYEIRSMSDAGEIRAALSVCRKEAARLGVRLTFHPDQFVVMSSTDKDITRKSIEELDYQAEVGEWIGADVINIHAGGSYGDKSSALDRVAKAIDRLRKGIRERLTLENDDRVYTPEDLLPFCRKYGIPFVYDVHHHRCLPDGMKIEDVTRIAVKTWDREPVFHISSPRDGWNSGTPGPHSDYINIKDFPECWRKLNITIEVEAKAKEMAVKRLLKQLYCREDRCSNEKKKIKG